MRLLPPYSTGASHHLPVSGTGDRQGPARSGRQPSPQYLLRNDFPTMPWAFSNTSGSTPSWALVVMRAHRHPAWRIASSMFPLRHALESRLEIPDSEAPGTTKSPAAMGKAVSPLVEASAPVRASVREC
ncbi:hypothetical protein TARUN_7091 [Trichoderma arundinaceum]|uniref:Uncharacterized protein n=1 Tax=Trichoderma arundinaceum TaxID=490622 RepID=A0A395NH34_TRIAR|nr:hypothetical protein TARUN_7091 [Trichoderma arundinaceum]